MQRVLKWLGVVLGLGALAGIGYGVWRSQQPPSPLLSEQELAEQLKQLIAANDLRVRPVSVVTTVGQGAAPLADQLNICRSQPDQNCGAAYNLLRPGEARDERLKAAAWQSSLTYGVDAVTFATGVIAVGRSTMVTLAGDRVGMTCLLAHELAHHAQDHSFRHSVSSAGWKQLPEAEAQKRSLALSRQQELEADRWMLQYAGRAGVSPERCVRSIDALHRSDGDGTPTDPLATHPGYQERMENLQRELARIDPLKLKAEGQANLRRGSTLTLGYSPDLQLWTIWQPQE